MQKILAVVFFTLLFTASFSQSFLISTPRLEFNGNTLKVSYDIISGKRSDIFSVRVEICDNSGKPINPISLSGDVGDSISEGVNKTIKWCPADDGIYLDEDISVELKSKMHTKQSRKTTLLAQSLVLPGMGISRIKNGKPWWIMSVPAYASLAGGFVARNRYTKTYTEYRKETSPDERSNLLQQTQRNADLSDVLFISSAVIWIGNLVWVAATPNRNKHALHPGLSINSIPNGTGRFTLFSLNVDF